MCRRISAEYIIGNVLIEALERKKSFVDFDVIIKVDDFLYKELLEKYDTFSKVDFEDIYSTVDNYPYFFKAKGNRLELAVSQDEGELEGLKERLLRYFRIGLPKCVVEAIHKSSEMVFNMV